MYEATVESEILSNLRGNSYEVHRFYGPSDIQNIYNQADNKLGTVGKSVLCRVSSENRVPNNSGPKYYQVIYPVEIIIACSNLKRKRNLDEPREIYTIKKNILENLGSKQIELNGAKRTFDYQSGSNVSIDDKIDLYLMNWRIQAHYTLD